MIDVAQELRKVFWYGINLASKRRVSSVSYGEPLRRLQQAFIQHGPPAGATVRSPLPCRRSLPPSSTLATCLSVSAAPPLVPSAGISVHAHIIFLGQLSRISPRNPDSSSRLRTDFPTNSTLSPFSVQMSIFQTLVLSSCYAVCSRETAWMSPLHTRRPLCRRRLSRREHAS